MATAKKPMTKPAKKAAPKVKTIPNGTEVSYHYRSAIGHGTVVGVSKPGTTSDNTEYSIREHDHHVSATGSKEKAIVHHYGKALTRSGGKKTKK